MADKYHIVYKRRHSTYSKSYDHSTNAREFVECLLNEAEEVSILCIIYGHVLLPNMSSNVVVHDFYSSEGLTYLPQPEIKRKV